MKGKLAEKFGNLNIDPTKLKVGAESPNLQKSKSTPPNTKQRKPNSWRQKSVDNKQIKQKRSAASWIKNINKGKHDPSAGDKSARKASILALQNRGALSKGSKPSYRIPFQSGKKKSIFQKKSPKIKNIPNDKVKGVQMSDEYVDKQLQQVMDGLNLPQQSRPAIMALSQSQKLTMIQQFNKQKQSKKKSKNKKKVKITSPKNTQKQKSNKISFKNMTNPSNTLNTRNTRTNGEEIIDVSTDLWIKRNILSSAKPGLKADSRSEAFSRKASIMKLKQIATVSQRAGQIGGRMKASGWINRKQTVKNKAVFLQKNSTRTELSKLYEDRTQDKSRKEEFEHNIQTIQTGQKAEWMDMMRKKTFHHAKLEDETKQKAIAGFAEKLEQEKIKRETGYNITWLNDDDFEQGGWKARNINHDQLSRKYLLKQSLKNEESALKSCVIFVEELKFLKYIQEEKIDATKIEKEKEEKKVDATKMEEEKVDAFKVVKISKGVRKKRSKKSKRKILIDIVDSLIPPIIEEIENWKVGSKCEIYSKTAGKWMKGIITKIFEDDEGEWLRVQYLGDQAKDIQRYSEFIRIVKDSPIPPKEDTIVIAQDENNENDEIENWKVGSQCEIYSKTAGKWMEGRITKIYEDDEGEWLRVEYLGDQAKDIQRYSQFIRILNIETKDEIINEGSILNDDLKIEIRFEIPVIQPIFVDNVIITLSKYENNKKTKDNDKDSKPISQVQKKVMKKNQSKQSKLSLLHLNLLMESQTSSTEMESDNEQNDNDDNDDNKKEMNYDLFCMNNCDLLLSLKRKNCHLLMKVISKGLVMINSLRMIQLCNCGVNDYFMSQIVLQFMENMDDLKINTLDLQSNNIGDNGMLCLCELIKVNCKYLKVIRLQNNQKDISTGVCKQICDALELNDYIIKFGFEFRSYHEKDRSYRALKKNMDNARIQRNKNNKNNKNNIKI